MKVIAIERAPATEVKMEGVEGVRMRVLIGEEDGAPSFTMRLFELEPGGHTPQHAHPFEHEIIVRAGSGTLWTAAGEHTLEPGVVALVTGDVEHQFRAGPAGMEFYCLVPHEGHLPYKDR